MYVTKHYKVSSQFRSNNNNWGQLFTIVSILNIEETGDMYLHRNITECGFSLGY